MEIFSREKIQFLADVYLGESYYQFCNRAIQNHKNKFLLFNQIQSMYNNPKIVFCYIHKVLLLYEKLDNFKNDFILITAEEDTRITEDLYKKIADHPKIIKWYCQNLCFTHEKIIPIPIGIRNEEWGGNINFFTEIININIPKTKKMYFNFIKETNPTKRNECFNKLCNHYEFLPLIKYEDNLIRLAEYEFCICPEGNGVDTHRLCEAWYLKVVPIVLENDFINVIKNKANLPLIILKDWDDLKEMELDYNNYKDKFNDYKYLDFNYYKNSI
jgi:hypothetical protein